MARNDALLRYDLTDQRFGRLIARHRIDRKSGNEYLWLCECDCGATCYAKSSTLRQGTTRSCPACRYKKNFAPRTDCFAYSTDYKNGCHALIEMLCVTRGNCPFYEPKEKEN